MPADSLAVSDLALAAPVAEEAVGCTHCGLDVPVGLRVPASRPQFCCEGCRVAHAILNEHGLEHYYALPERRDRPVRSTGRTYEEFDHDAFHELYVTPTPEGLSRVELYLEGVHCASCVWLVERVPLVIPGVVRAELNVRRALATIEWDAGAVSLSAIARTLDRLGYAAHPFRGIRRDLVRRQEDRAALVRIGVAGAIAVNVMLPALALYSGALSGMEPVYTRFFRWISLVLTVPAMLGPGRVFFTGALGALRTRTLHMDLPIAIALCAGFVRGAINTVTDSGPIYFDGLTMLVFLLLCGRWLQARGQRRAGDAAELLYALTPSVARVVEMETSGAERVREMPANALLPDQLLEVRAGEMLAADGIVVTGNSTVDRALLTGESRPAAVHPGDEIFAGTLNVAAPLRARVTRAGEATRVARILEQVERSAQRRAPVVLLADRMSGWFVAAVLTLAVVVYVVWWRRGSPDAMDNAIALLLVTCPCALALATPLAVTAAIGRAARAGIFIKGADALELLARPARLILDKTGTITEARTTLVAWSGPEWVKPLALALESGSTHPVADGFRRAWTGVIPATDGAGIEHVVGGGIRGTVDGHRVVVGSPSFVAAHAREVPNTAPLPDALSPVWIAVDDVVVARAGFGDAIRTGSHSAISALAKRGWRLSIVSGDDQRAVRYTGAALGINQDSCFGGVSPEEKLAHVERARREGRGAVVMVGDGVNDAAAIAAASVGIGVHGGAEACLATADVYLTSPGLGALVDLTDGAARTMRVIRRNIAFSLAYNVVGAALAVTGIITPLIAALLMPASSLTVLIASWRGRTFEPRAS